MLGCVMWYGATSAFVLPNHLLLPFHSIKHTLHSRTVKQNVAFQQQSVLVLHGSLDPNDPTSSAADAASSLASLLSSAATESPETAAAAAAAAGAAAAATGGIPSLPLLIAPALAWLAGQEAVRRKQALTSQESITEQELNQIRQDLQSTETAIVVRLE